MPITKTLRVKDHSLVKYDVTAENYYPANGQYIMDGDDHTEYVNLVPIGGDLTFVIQCVQENAVIKINGQEISTISLPGGSTISWEVSAEGFDTQRGVIVDLNPTSPGVASPLIIDLSLTQLTFTIVAIPADSIVTINGETRSQAILPIGSRVEWVASCEGWTSQNGEVPVLAADSPGVASPLQVDLTRQDYTLTVNAQPETASVSLTYNGITDTKTGVNSVTVQAGGVVHVLVQNTGYTTFEQDVVVDTPNKALPVVLVPDYYVFRINATPEGAYIVITENGESVDGTTTCEKNVAPGASVRYQVTKEGFSSVDQTVTVNQNTTLPVNLSARTVSLYVYCGYPTTGATVRITDERGNSIENAQEAFMSVPYGTYCTYSVSAPGFSTKGQTIQVTGNISQPVYLDANTATLTVVGYPSGSTIVIAGGGQRAEGTDRAQLTVTKSTLCSYTVSHAGYDSISDSYTVNSDVTIPVNLAIGSCTFRVISYVANANVTLSWTGGTSTQMGQNSVQVPSGSRVTYTVACQGYQTEEDTITVLADRDLTVYLKQMFNVQITALFPSWATVTIWKNGMPSVEDHFNMTTAVEGTDIKWAVDADGFVSQEDRFNITHDVILGINLTQQQIKYRFTVNTSESNTVIINGQATNSIEVYPGTRCNYEVSREGYNTYTGYYDMGAANYTTPLITLTPIVQYCTLNVTTTPGNCTIWLNGTKQSSIIVEKGSSVHYKVEKLGFVTQENDVVVNQNPQTLDIHLVEAQFEPTLTVVPVPSTASVTIINGSVRDTKTGTNSMQVPMNTPLSYVVSLAGYLDKGEENLVMTENVVRQVELQRAEPTTCTITLVPSDPANAVCYINGVQTRSSVVPIGSTVTWRAEHPDYVTGEGSLVAQGDTTIPIQLVRLYNVTVTATPRDSYVSLWINGALQSITQGYNTMRAPAGSLIRWDVERDDYYPKSETIERLSSDINRDVTLDQIQIKYRFTIVPTPSDSDVYIGDVERTYVDVHPGTVLNWRVQRENYITQQGQYQIQTSNYTLPVTLEPIPATTCRLTINPIPPSARVRLDGVLKEVGFAYVDVPQNTSVHVNIQKLGYITYDDDILVTQVEQTETIALQEENPIIE